MAEEASQIRAELAQDREALASTLQQLAEKADVKGRLKEKAAETTGQVREKAVETTGQLREKAVGTTEQLREKAAGAGRQLQEMASDKVHLEPDELKEKASSALKEARRKPAVAVIGVLLVALLVGGILARRHNRRSPD